MGKTRGKKPAHEGFQKGNHSMNPDRPRDPKQGNLRDRATIKRLLMYKNSKPIRDRKGKIVKAAPFQDWLPSGSVSRIAPNQKWFNNTRTITQSALQSFQEELGKVIKDPYQVVMRQTNLPITLLNEKSKNANVHILDTDSFNNTFGKKAQRKRPNLKINSLDELVSIADKKAEVYDADKDKDLVSEIFIPKDEVREAIMKKGTSRRIWGELFKVIDSSDVILQVLDARNPMGTRSLHVEKFLKKEKPHKHLVLILNKCDLVPVWVTQRWVTILSAEYPTMAFHSSIKNPFGKGALIDLLRQFGKLHQDKKQISIGLIGYPNVGKSSVINALRGKKVCNVAPIAGETKVWQFITLMKRIFLIDCPGIVYPTDDDDTDIVLKGVVRVENIKTPEDHIEEVLNRVKPEYVTKTYKIDSWTNAEDFLSKLCERTGKLLKKGEPDISTAAKMVLNDFQRGKLPYFVKPPTLETDDKKEPEKTTQVTQSVKQRLSKIQVEPAFDEDDCKTIVEDETAYDSDNENDEIDDDSEMEAIEEIDDRPEPEPEPEEKRVKLNSKQKRALDRAQKSKKVGVHFYENVDVKNRRSKKRKSTG
ncbi:nucleolar GTP-binding protein 2-like [Panonychus citri]|uniref:nucleolar GTP-binding protein 2-like n=1 Tax=Panonychus citri TaxID=50023 RepID=UPI0023072924|nr:nucleolar GTP-binding protein 2-like [Panonychus citri]